MILFLKMLMGHYITEGTGVYEIVVFPSKSKLTHLPSDCSFYLFCKKVEERDYRSMFFYMKDAALDLSGPKSHVLHGVQIPIRKGHF